MHCLRLVIITVFLCSTAVCALAVDSPPTLRGKVYEKGSRRPLEGVTVFVAEDDSLSALTEADGGFTLDLPAGGEYTLIAAAVGFVKSSPRHTTTATDGGKTALVFYLEPIYSLDEVVVEAARNPDKTAKTVMTGKELAAVPGSAGDPLRAIQALPGITTSDDTSSAPAIRGSGPENNAYYVDFLPVGYLFHMGGMVSVFNGDLVEDFNIYSSSFGPEYADVTGGVLDVRLRQPRTDRLGAKVNIGMLESDLLVEGPLASDQSFYLAARRSYIDLLVEKTGEADTGVEYTQFPNFFDYQGKYVWRNSSDSTLTLMANGAGDEIALKLTDEAKAVQHDPILAGNIEAETSYHSQGLLLNSRLTSRLTNRFGLSRLSSDSRQQLTQLGHVSVKNESYLLRDHLILRAGANHELLFGLEAGLSETKLDLDMPKTLPSDFAPDPDYTSSARFLNTDRIRSHQLDLAMKDRWRFHERGTLILGLHGSYEDYFDRYRAEPRLGLELNPLKNTLLTAGWGRYHQFPLGHQIIEGSGNPNLNYEEAEHYSLGVVQSLADAWSVRLEGYYKELSRLVVPHDPENYLNGGSGEAYGAELLIKKDRTADWSGWVSLAYAETRRQNDLTGEDFPYRYDQPLVVNLVYQWNFARNWSFGAKWRYQTGAPFTPVVGTYTDGDGRLRPIYGELGSERLPAYHRLDLRLTREFLYNRWKLSVYLDILNAYARQNVSGYEYSGDYSSREEITQLPFIPAFGIRGEF